MGAEYSIVDMAAWGWIDRAPIVLPDEADPLAAYPNLKRWFTAINARPAVARAHCRQGCRLQAGDGRSSEARDVPVELSPRGGVNRDPCQKFAAWRVPTRFAIIHRGGIGGIL